NKRNKNSVHLFKAKYNDRGNLVEAYSQRANGEPKLTFGMCKISRYTVDERGNWVETYCIRQDGQLSKLGFAISKNKFDDDDQMIESAYFDGDGHPSLMGGAFLHKLTYDPDGNITEFAAYDTDGKPIVGSDGYHKMVSEFKNGHEIRTEYRNLDG